MTREEAIDVLQEKHDECKAFYDLAAHPEEAYPGAKEYMEALQMALAALRGPTREQVDRVLGSMWEFDANNFEYNWRCVTCGAYTDIKTDFCPRCGAPMTDEAVEITLQRSEALYETKAD